MQPAEQGAEGIRIPSRLWIDQPEARERIDQQRRSGALETDLAARLANFEHHGYTTFSLEGAADCAAALREGVDRLWSERPPDLAYASGGPPRRLALADPERERRPGSRLHDVHSHLQAARDLFLHPALHGLAAAIFGEPAVAIQSLSFDYGSEQTLHRDEVVVPVSEPGHLLAAWIALEDIHPDCGPLLYVAGSHRLPCFETEPGEYRFDGRRMSGELVTRGLAWEAEQERRAGLQAEPFLARCGEVLVWHGALRHGGAPVRDPARTRRSFVVHFSTSRTHHERSISILEDGADGERWQVYRTEETVAAPGARGFQNPLLGR